MSSEIEVFCDDFVLIKIEGDRNDALFYWKQYAEFNLMKLFVNYEFES